MAPNVALVYGSFFMGDCERDVKTIFSGFPKIEGLEVAEPVEVYGNGDETYFKTYMNMPRYMDKLLEKCGSKRFFARGETGEPHAPLDTEKCTCTEWTPAMWKAAESAMKEPASVPWDALWAKHPSEHHSDVTEWTLKKLETKLGKLKGPPSMFSRL